MNPAALSAQQTFERSVAPGTRIYALLDAAREPAGPRFIAEAGLACESLFAGDMGDRLKGVAPYLIDLGFRSNFISWWFEQWGNSIGVLLESPVSMADLRRHFRTLLIVRGDDRKRYYFRFYDPRVLRGFLPTCTDEELARFYGPVHAFHCEDPNAGELLSFAIT